MSLKSVTEKIDNIITLLVLTFCVFVWAILGFPYFAIVGAAATCVIFFVLGAFVWKRVRQRS